MHRSLAILAAGVLTTACAPQERSDSQPWTPLGPPGASEDDDGNDDDTDEPDERPDEPEDDDPDPSTSTTGSDDPPVGGSSSGADPPMESPYQGGWDVGDCQDSITAGSDVINDITLIDQYGDHVRLYDFCHMAVYFVGGALW